MSVRCGAGVTGRADKAWLSAVAAAVDERLGLHLPPDRWSELWRAMGIAARSTGDADPAAFARRLMEEDEPHGPALEGLGQALAVGETYFFREPRSLELIAECILPVLIAQRRAGPRVLRLWSAACCTGEEAYTLAMLVDRLLPERQDWHVTLLATDLNLHFLRTAARGEYGEWSFREAPAWIKERYFTRTEDRRYRIAPTIRRMVRFAPLNLAEPCYPSAGNDTQAMDLILCRNVLMYFSPAQAQRVVARLAQALAPGGRLLVGTTENPLRSFEPLLPERHEGVVFHRRPGPQDVATPAPPALLAAFAPALAPSPTPCSTLSSPSPTPSPTPSPVQAATPAPSQTQQAHPRTPPPVPPPRPSRAGPAATGRPASAPVFGQARVAAPAAAEPAPADALERARRDADAGRLPQALAAVEEALVAAKLDAHAQHLHAAILLEMGRDAEARAALQRALYLEPGFVLAHHALGLLALRQGRRDEARRHLGNVLDLLSPLPADELLPHGSGLLVAQVRDMVATALERVR